MQIVYAQDVLLMSEVSRSGLEIRTKVETSRIFGGTHLFVNTTKLAYGPHTSKCYKSVLRRYIANLT